MLKISILIASMFGMVAAPALLVTPAEAQVHVRGHYRSNGTYVQPHYRSSPDGNPYNNYSCC